MSRSKIVAMLAVVAGLAVFVAANAHLLVVAFESQPECVEHARIGHSQPGQLSAAKSAC